MLHCNDAEDSTQTDFCTLAAVLQARPSQRCPSDVDELTAYLEELPFFAGVDFPVLRQICGVLGLQVAAPGEALLHVGELTDRMYVLLRGRCSLVRHSRREGFSPRPAQLLEPGQALCEAALVLSGRLSDVAVTAMPEEPLMVPGSEGTDADGGGAYFAVLTRAAWNELCARAPNQPEYAEARMAVLCCAARSLAGGEPSSRTPEQAEDLGAVLRLMPALSASPPAVLRCMSESACLRCLPPGCVLFEEATRAEAQFVVLGGEVQTRSTKRRLHKAGGAAGQSAGAAPRSSRWSARRCTSASNRRRTGSETMRRCKTVQEMIEEERKSREELQLAMSQFREGLRAPSSRAGSRTQPKQLQAAQWTSEFIGRARKQIGGSSDPASGYLGPQPTTSVPSSSAPSDNASRAPSRALLAWRRAVFQLTHAAPAMAKPRGSRADAAAHRPGLDGSVGSGSLADGSWDATLHEYELQKRAEAGGSCGIGELVGGRAYVRAIEQARAGLRERQGFGYDDDDSDDVATGRRSAEGRLDEGVAQQRGKSPNDRKSPVRLATVGGGDEDTADIGDDRIRVIFLNKEFRLTPETARFVEAVEQLVLGAAERRGRALQPADGGEPQHPNDAGGGPSHRAAADAAGASGGALGRSGTRTRGVSWNLEGRKAPSHPPGADGAVAAAAGADAARGPHAGSARVSEECSAPSSCADCQDDTNDDHGDDDDDVRALEACEAQLDRLFGPLTGRVEAGRAAGELLPRGTVAPSTDAGWARLRRTETAIAGPCGADVLVVSLPALRRGAEAAREEVLSERGAALAALEPMRGVKGEAQAALALEAEVLSVDANQVIVRQGQPVDALYVVLDGEVRLLDDPDSAAAFATAEAAEAAAAPGPADKGRSVSSGAAASGGAAGGAAAAAAGAAGPQPGGVLSSIRARRAVATLSALTLLGPGGSFGEGVLGYPGDEAGPAAAAALPPGQQELRRSASGRTADGGYTSDALRDGVTSTGGGDDDDDDDHSDDDELRTRSGLSVVSNSSFRARKEGGRRPDGAAAGGGAAASQVPPRPSARHLATAVASRPSRLLLLRPGSLMAHPALRTSLPPFAALRREALEARRRQLQQAVQNLQGGGGGGGGGGRGGGGQQGVEGTAGAAARAMGAARTPVVLQLATAASAAPTAASPFIGGGGGGGAGGGGGGERGDERGLVRFPSMPLPRPPPPRPSEVLEQMGFKTVTNPRTAALLASLSATASIGAAGSSGDTTPEQRTPTSGTPTTGPGTPLAPKAATHMSPFSPGGAAAGSLGGVLASPSDRTGRLGAALGSTGTGAATVWGPSGSRPQVLSQVLEGAVYAPAATPSPDPNAPSFLDAGDADVSTAADGGGGGGGGGPFRPLLPLPAAAVMSAQYAQMSQGELEVLSTTAANEASWAAVGAAAAAGGRAPPKPRVQRTSLSGIRTAMSQLAPWASTPGLPLVSNVATMQPGVTRHAVLPGVAPASVPGSVGGEALPARPRPGSGISGPRLSLRPPPVNGDLASGDEAWGGGSAGDGGGFAAAIASPTPAPPASARVAISPRGPAAAAGRSVTPLPHLVAPSSPSNPAGAAAGGGGAAAAAVTCGPFSRLSTAGGSTGGIAPRSPGGVGLAAAPPPPPPMRASYAGVGGPSYVAYFGRGGGGGGGGGGNFFDDAAGSGGGGGGGGGAARARDAKAGNLRPPAPAVMADGWVGGSGGGGGGGNGGGSTQSPRARLGAAQALASVGSRVPAPVEVAAADAAPGAVVATPRLFKGRTDNNSVASGASPLARLVEPPMRSSWDGGMGRQLPRLGPGGGGAAAGGGGSGGGLGAAKATSVAMAVLAGVPASQLYELQCEMEQQRAIQQQVRSVQAKNC